MSKMQPYLQHNYDEYQLFKLLNTYYVAIKK
jgi:hypothetical protein